VAFDGAGYGPDGTIWGGEFLVGDYDGFERAGHLRYIAMPGGEMATREPWRMAAAHLADAGVGCDRFERRQDAGALRTVRRMIERGFNSPKTSSAGRLFDAVAALAGVRDRVSHEGQAAMELEWIAAGGEEGYPFRFDEGDGGIVVDTRPMIAAAAREVDGGVEAGRIAGRFHATLVEMIAAVCVELRKRRKIDGIILTGGCFLNSILALESSRRLAESDFRVYCHEKAPPGDGGLSLGQLAIAASQQRKHGCALAYPVR
jgi:hydrogenase maturation protein HypF